MKLMRLLMIEDDSTFKTALFRALTRSGYSVTTATTKKEALQWLQIQTPWDAILLDIQLPDGNGLDVLDLVKSKFPQLPVIVLTGHTSLETALSATQRGASEVLNKPLSLDDILTCLKNNLTSGRHATPSLHREDHSGLAHSPSAKGGAPAIIGESQEMKSVLSMISRVAESDATILIQGESGTGKELIARAIHQMSPRRNAPFIAINCGAIPSELLESELFGHMKGAFTGAISNRIGRFEMADGGILFLDEIGDMSPNLQVKILRALQERTFEPVGATKSVQVNVQVIAATHINLEKAVQEGRFREDLFYRLNVIPIAVPPLRERKFDIPILLNHFLSAFTKKRKEKLAGFSQETLENLMNYAWPGNIRELENLVERLTIIKGQGIVEVRDLPPKYLSTKSLESQSSPTQSFANPDIPNEGVDFNAAVDAFENNLIMKALEKTGWNRNQAALLLKLNRTTLVEKMKKKGLRPADEIKGDSNSEFVDPSPLTETLIDSSMSPC